MKVLLFLWPLVVVSTAVNNGKRCPSLSVQDPFEFSNFTGTWHKVMYQNTPLEIGSCIQATYSLSTDSNTTFNIDSSIKTVFGGKEEARGTAVKSDLNNDEGKLSLTMDTLLGSESFDLWVLATDYDSYAILYSCTEVYLGWWQFPYESVWVLTRDWDLSNDVGLLIATAMTEIEDEGGPSFSNLGISSQTNCEY